MYRSVLVPLDGSAFGEHALPLALSIAERAHASLQVVHVHALAASLYGGTELIADLRLDATVKAHFRIYLDSVVGRLAKISSVPVTSALLEADVAEAVHEHARATGADLIVMSTHGRGPMSRLWLGSIADKLIRKATMPVLLLRPQEAAPDLASKPVLRRVLIPLDGSDQAEQILEPAIELGSLMQADYTLLLAIKPMVLGHYDASDPSPSPLDASLLKQLQVLYEDERKQAQNYLERIAERLRARSLRVQTHVGVHEQPAVAILERVKAGLADLIALAAHGRGGVSRLLLGSVADKVLRAASIPVLVHHPSGK